MNPTSEKKIETNPVRVIFAKCKDCCCGSVKEVRLCPAEDCPLWPWRLGKNPYRKKATREYSDEEREAARQRMKALHQRNSDFSENPV